MKKNPKLFHKLHEQCRETSQGKLISRTGQSPNYNRNISTSSKLKQLKIQQELTNSKCAITRIEMTTTTVSQTKKPLKLIHSKKQASTTSTKSCLSHFDHPPPPVSPQQRPLTPSHHQPISPKMTTFLICRGLLASPYLLHIQTMMV